MILRNACVDRSQLVAENSFGRGMKSPVRCIWYALSTYDISETEALGRPKDVVLTAAAAIANTPIGRFPAPGSSGVTGLRIPYAVQ